MRRLIVLLAVLSSTYLFAAKPTQRDIYLDLTRQLTPYIHYQQWDKATELALSYQKKLGSYADYQSLMKTLQQPEDSTVIVHAFPNTINTLGDEYGPVLSADGRLLLFCGKDRRDNLRGEDIYYSRLLGDGQWTRARLLMALSSDDNDAPLSLSADGKTMLLFRRGQICVSFLDGDRWSRPAPLPESLRLSTWQADAILTADGKSLLFVAATATENDPRISPNIYVSTYNDDGTWTTPIELGPTINTPYIDRAPFLHPDMKTLYFASEGHGSLGGLDIYRCTRLNPDSWTEWSEPVNLGKQINTPGQDSWFRLSADGRIAYLSRAFPQRGLDLCWILLPQELRPEAVVIAEDTVATEDVPPIRLNNIFFATAEAKLLPTSLPELQRVLELLLPMPFTKTPAIEIAGHTDSEGSEADNQLLSERRAAAVRDWLVEHGCESAWFTIRGYGETMPVADNNTAEGRKLNRRVEIKFL